MKKIISLIFLCAAIAGCGKLNKDGRIRQEIDWSKWYNDATIQEDDRPSVKVMTFNVRYYSTSETEPQRLWTNRRDGVYEMMRTLKPVLMGTQECYKTQANDIKAALPEYDWVGTPRDGASSNSEMVAVFYLKDSVQVEESKTFWLSDRPTVPSRPPGVEANRCATIVKVKHLSTGKRFWFLSTHLDLGAKDFEMQVLTEQINKTCEENDPIILVADWNVPDDDPVFEYISTYKNARDEAVIGDNYNSYNGFTKPAGSSQIDHIFYTGFPACSHFVTVRDKWAGYNFISDHFPVYAILKLE